MAAAVAAETAGEMGESEEVAGFEMCAVTAGEVMTPVRVVVVVVKVFLRKLDD